MMNFDTMVSVPLPILLMVVSFILSLFITQKTDELAV